MRRLKKHFLTLLCLVCMVALPAGMLTGCVSREMQVRQRLADADLRTITPERAGQMSEIELVQTMIRAIESDKNVDDAYLSIPEKQRPDISNELFHRYVRTLRRAVLAKVTGFAEVAPEESAALRKTIARNLPEWSETAEKTSFYWLFYRISGKLDDRFALAIQHDANGMPLLSSDWLNHLLDLADFAYLYFNALEVHDLQALAYLLAMGEKEPASSSTLNVLMTKARALDDFYTNNIHARTSEYRMLDLLPGTIVYEQSGIINRDGTTQSSRNVTFNQQGGRYVVNDIVLDVLNLDDAIIYSDDRELIIVGGLSAPETNSSYWLGKTLGTPLSVQPTQSRAASGSEDVRFTVAYPGLTLNASGRYYDDKSWTGSIYYTEISDERYVLGSGLKVGMSVIELYERYPFARESGFVLSHKTPWGTVTLTVQVENGTIIKLILARQTEVSSR